MAYNNRGAWLGKAYGKAMADLNEALRIDPRRTPAYVNRAAAWLLMDELGKSIADCNEAIGSIRTMRLAFCNRAGGHAAQK